jgi:hypothetical protein
MMAFGSWPEEYMLYLADGILFTVWMAIPMWWAALRAFPRRWGLPRPLRFTAISAALSYGPIVALFLIVSVPLSTAATYLGWQLTEVGSDVGQWLFRLDKLVRWAITLLIVLLPGFSWIVTRNLARYWHRLYPV